MRTLYLSRIKRNDSTGYALKQILDKKYFESLDGYKGRILFVGINYDEKEKTHTCEINAYEK